MAKSNLNSGVNYRDLKSFQNSQRLVYAKTGNKSLECDLNGRYHIIKDDIIVYSTLNEFQAAEKYNSI